MFVSQHSLICGSLLTDWKVRKVVSVHKSRETTAPIIDRYLVIVCHAK